MPEGTTDKKPRLSPGERAALPSTRLHIDDETRNELTAYFTQSIELCLKKRAQKKDRYERHKETLRGRNPLPPIKSGVSNVSVPLTMWARTAVRARLKRALKQRPFMTALPTGQEIVGDVNLKDLGKQLAKFMTAMIHNPRELNGEECMRKSATEATDCGTGGWLVHIEPDQYAYLPPSAPFDSDGKPNPPEKRIKHGRVRWTSIPFMRLLYMDGYGLDVNLMPFVGYETKKSWASMRQWAVLDHYDPEAVERVKAHYERETGEKADAVIKREHKIAEIYTDWPVKVRGLGMDTGIPAAIVVDWHVEAKEVMRVSWNNFEGRRPIVLHQLDVPADQDEVQGQGVPEKLEGPQEEANVLHNIGIEAGKRAIMPIALIKSDSALSEEIGGDEEMMPGFHAETEDPETDLRVEHLANLQAPELALGLEERNQQYAEWLLGLDRGRAGGDPQAGKRVPASLGLSITREGRVVIEDAIGSFATAVIEATYLTLDAYRKRFPKRALINILGEETAAQLQQVVFNTTSDTARDVYAVTVNAVDAASVAETKKNELFVLQQFLAQHYKQILETLMLLGQMPQAKPIVDMFIEKMTAGAHMLLSSIESVNDPTDVLIDLDVMQQALGPMFGAAGGGAPSPAGGDANDLDAGMS